METEYSYAPPLDKLLTYGDCRNFEGWPNYLELGFTDKHILELIRMALDEDLLWADSDSCEVWVQFMLGERLGNSGPRRRLDRY